MTAAAPALTNLLAQIRSCALCPDLPLGPQPIVQAGSGARILIAGQAPGRITHAKGRPFDDPSGQRLRDWLGVSETQFYDPDCFAIVPMGFCYPGTGSGGDLPPPARCAPQWRQALLGRLPAIALTLVIGQYALDWHLAQRRQRNLTATVRDWRSFWPALLPLPHPSPRNNRWLKTNPWFAEEVLPALRRRVQDLV
jgi:uracil-DNA glycosylase